MRGVAERVPKAILFVHNPDPQRTFRGVLFGLARSLAGHAGAAPGRRKPEGDRGDRWRVLVQEGGPPLAAALRHILSPLCIPAGFDRVLLVHSGGRVELLETQPRPWPDERSGGSAAVWRPSDAWHG